MHDTGVFDCMYSGGPCRQIGEYIRLTFQLSQLVCARVRLSRISWRAESGDRLSRIYIQIQMEIKDRGLRGLYAQAAHFFPYS